MEGTSDKGYGQKTLGEYQNMQLETYFTYEKSFAGKHTINLLGGYSYLENIYEGFGAERRGFDTDLFLYNNLASGQDFRAGDVYSYKGSARLISFFARANYNYSGKYLFTGTIRRDGSTRFGENNKWDYFHRRLWHGDFQMRIHELVVRLADEPEITHRIWYYGESEWYRRV